MKSNNLQYLSKTILSSIISSLRVWINRFSPSDQILPHTKMLKIQRLVNLTLFPEIKHWKNSTATKSWTLNTKVTALACYIFPQAANQPYYLRTESNQSKQGYRYRKLWVFLVFTVKRGFGGPKMVSRLAQTFFELEKFYIESKKSTWKSIYQNLSTFLKSNEKNDDRNNTILNSFEPGSGTGWDESGNPVLCGIPGWTGIFRNS